MKQNGRGIIKEIGKREDHRIQTAGVIQDLPVHRKSALIVEGARHGDIQLLIDSQMDGNGKAVYKPRIEKTGCKIHSDKSQHMPETALRLSIHIRFLSSSSLVQSFTEENPCR